MFGLGFQEILLILVIIFLLFGVKRLPDIGKGLGETMREIRKIRDERKTGKEKEKDKEKDKENQKGNLISDIKKEVEEIPGLKEAKEIKEVADKVKGITKFLK
jgi:sec-independent protein translocase protein TatA